MVPCKRGHVYYAGQRIRAIKHAVGAAKDFNLINAGGEDSAKIDRAANFIKRNAIQKDFVEFALTSADKQGIRWSRAGHFPEPAHPGTCRSGSSTSGVY